MPFFGVPIRNGLPIGLGSVAGFGVQQFDPSQLFEGGTVAGAWYDPSDLSTMFTTDAGTTPVAMPGQGAGVAVGLILDKSGNGNHARSFGAGLSSTRPELRARVNLLTYSEQFDNGAWAKGNVTITANTSATTDPLGGNTADKLASNTAASIDHTVDQTVVINSITTFSVYAKAGELSRIALGRTSGPVGKVFDLVAGTAHDLGPSSWSGWTSATAGNFSIQSAGNGWWRVSITAPASAVNGRNDIYLIDNNGNERTFATASGNGVYIWGADLRPANIGANVPAYQRIADALTYDTNGFPLYLYFDGTDDSMYTPANLNLSGTDKVAVFAGVRKLSSLVNFYSELTTNAFTLAGGFSISSSLNTYAFVNQGSFYEPSGYVPQISNVLACSYDLSKTTLATEIIPRINGVVTQTGGFGSGSATGNFANAPLFIGARNNASFFLNGHLHSLIIAGSAVSAGNISATEQWVAGKTGIQI